MSGALTAGRVTKEYAPLTVLRSYPMDALAQIWQGGIVALDATGYAVPGATATTLIAVGVAQESKLAGSVDGDTNIQVHIGVFHLNVDSTFAQTAVGSICYIVDDQTVSLNASGKSIAGTVAAVDADGAWVAMGLEAAIDNTTLTAFESALASTSTPGGASLVGVFDTDGLYTATTVEAALAEAIGSNRIATIADGALGGGVPVAFEFAVTDAASSHTDYVIVPKFEITEVVVRKNTSNGGSGDTIQLLNSSTAITDAMSLNINTKLLVRAASIDPAQAVISAGGTLRVQWVKSTNVACQITVFGIKRS